MVRTKGDGGAARTVASKAPRKNLGGGGSSAASRAISAAGAGASPGGAKYGGGNSYNPQPVPGWQKPLTSFFKRDPNAPPPKMRDEEEEDEETKTPKDKGKGKGKGKSSKKVEKEEDEENEPPKKKAKGGKAKKVDDGKPKRPMSAYFLWMNEVGRKSAKEKYPEAPITEVSKRCGEEWKAMDEATKKTWEKKQVEAKKQFEIDMEEWKNGGKKAKEVEEEDVEEEDVEEEEEVEESAGGSSSKSGSSKLQKNGLISDSEED